MDSIDPRRRAGRDLARKMAPKLALIPLGLAAVVFIPAGTFAFWQAWIFLAALLAPMTAVLIYLMRYDPGLLERRLQMREKEPQQKLVIKLGGVCVAALMVLPGLDRRWGWSEIPAALTLAADVVLVGAYLFVFWVLKVNSYASRTVEVRPGQQIITTGPYAIVRHPMYLGSLTLYLMIPLALGSFWALLAYPPLPFIFALRIRNEEEVLMKDLAGYAEYRETVRAKVLPRIW
ncbi:MAG TPA: isoprenylcysteine carboxylmethyltransferase family protein [Acidobacteriota bacterium]|nr:isoprenylcysteine carboxylmethyltransferase family protein [Acidobacteriota bacterium]